MRAFVTEYGERDPKAVASLVKDEEKLLRFYDFPAAHWQTIRSTNVIESAFATVKLRQRVTKGAGTRTRGLTMAFQLLAMAEKRWRKIRSPHLVQQLLDGARGVSPIVRSQAAAWRERAAAAAVPTCRGARLLPRPFGLGTSR